MNIKKLSCAVLLLASVATLLPATAAAQQVECHIQGDSEQAIADYGQCLSRARARVAQARATLEQSAAGQPAPATPPRRRTREVPVREVASAAPAPVQPAPIRVQPLSRQATGPVAPLRSLAPRSAPQVEPQAVAVPPLASAAPAPQAPVQPVVQAPAPVQRAPVAYVPAPDRGPPPILAELRQQPDRRLVGHDPVLRSARSSPCILITNMDERHRAAAVAGRGLSRNRGGSVDYPYAVSLTDFDGRPIIFQGHRPAFTTQGPRSLVEPGQSACIPICPPVVQVGMRRACGNGIQLGAGGSFHFNLWYRFPDGTYALVTYSDGRGVQGDISVSGAGEYILQHEHLARRSEWDSRQPLTR